MSNPVTFNVDRDLYTKCCELIDAKEFKSDSEMIDFAIRIFYYQIMVKGFKPKLIKHDNEIKKSARVNHYIVDLLVNTGMFKKNELANYALAYLLECRMKFDEECNIFE